MIKAIIFDLDDTLYSERQYIDSGYHHIAKIISNKIGIKEDAIYKIMVDLFNKDSSYVFNRLYDKLEIPYLESEIIKLVDAYRNHKPQIIFYDDVIPCINSMKEIGIKSGIISDGHINSQKNKIEALHADKYFNKIILTDELGREYWKPHPKAFEIMQAAMDIEYDEMMYIGDNPEKDFYIKKTYPIKTARILRDNSLYKEKMYFNDIHEDFIIVNLDAVLQYL